MNLYNNPISIRIIDGLGRIIIPQQLLNQLHLAEGDRVDVYGCENGVYITPTYPCCSICRSREGLLQVNSRHLCFHCIKDIKAHLGPWDRE